MFRIMVLIALIPSVFFTGCKKDMKSQNKGNGSFNRSVRASVDIDPRNFTYYDEATIPNTIAGNYVLTNDKVWILDGPTFVSPTGVLTIQPNTLIKGRKVSTSGDPSFLVITAGGRLEADGNDPNTSIVFTSDQRSNAQPGDWGGVILLGNARTNNYPAQIEGIDPSEIPTGYNTVYGSSTNTNNASSSGILRYVRIEFAGRDLLSGQGNEINSLTLGGVGSGTTLSHIMVSYGFDDGFEFFGGTVNADHLVSYAMSDDDFDFDNGYTGSINYAVSLRNPDVTFTSDPNGIESTNDAFGSANTPQTKPVLRYFTILGTQTRDSRLLYGNNWKSNTALDMQYSIITGYDEAAVNLNTPSANVIFTNNLYQGFQAGILPIPPIGNTPVTTTANLIAPFTIGNPDFRLFTLTPGYGAFGPYNTSRWDNNWASYDPLLNSY